MLDKRVQFRSIAQAIFSPNDGVLWMWRNSAIYALHRS